MISNNLDVIWQRLMVRLEASVTPSQMGMYLRQLVPLNLEANSLTASVNSQTLKTNIEERFSEIIDGILAEITNNPDISLNIIVASYVQPSIPFPDPEQQVRPITDQNNNIQEKFQSNLNPHQTFQNFVLGNSNRFAHASAVAVVEKPLGEGYNPLFIYGNSGIGKTHLMNAIGNALLKRNPDLKVLYLTCETFMNEMITAIQNKTTDFFHKKYRNIDCLIIDDIQFLQNKESTQEEFFHTFNALKEASKQIIITSDRRPQDLNGLEDRLISRFASGLTADIQAPDFETRMAILRSHAQEEGVNMPQEVIQLIAQNITHNVRLLEGAFNRIVAYSELMKVPIDLSITLKVLEDIVSSTQQSVTIDKIIDYVCDFYDLRREDLLGKKRPKNIANPRQIAMYMCRTMTDASLPKIGDAFGGRDHTTVIHACEKVHKLISKDKKFEKDLNAMIQDIRQK